MITRRGFLGSILALAAAPAIVRASSLMPVRRLDGLTSDIIALKAQQLVQLTNDLLLSSLNIEEIIRADLARRFAEAVDRDLVLVDDYDVALDLRRDDEHATSREPFYFNKRHARVNAYRG